MFDRIAPCLHDLADDLEAAQSRDRLARERIQAMLPPEGSGQEDLGPALAAEVDEMAAALEQASGAVDEEAAELNKYADEAGTMWLTQVQVETPGLPGFYRDDRMPVEEILLRYRQPDDPRGMVIYERGFTVGPWEVGGSKEMTATEADLLDELNPLEARDAQNIYNDAFDHTADRFGPQNEREGADLWRADAWRHAHWSARMTQRFGTEWAEEFGTAHEGQHGNHPTQNEYVAQASSGAWLVPADADDEGGPLRLVEELPG